MPEEESVPVLVVVKSPKAGPLAHLGVDLPTMIPIGESHNPSRVAFKIRTDRVVAGRSPDCDLLLDHITVSRNHFAIRKAPEGYLISDLGSTCGTIVNDKEARSEVLLKNGDSIKAGKFTLRFTWK